MTGILASIFGGPFIGVWCAKNGQPIYMVVFLCLVWSALMYFVSTYLELP